MLELFAVKNFPPQERKFFAPESEKVVELFACSQKLLM